jgi:hypothetical protein
MNSFSPQWYVFKIFNTIAGFMYIISVLLKEQSEKLSFPLPHQKNFLIYLHIIRYSSFSTSFGIIGLSFVSLTMNHDLHHFFAIIYFISNLVGLIFTDLFNLKYKQNSNRSIIFTFLACFFAISFYFSPWFSNSNALESFSNICEHLTIIVLALKVIFLSFQFPNIKIQITLLEGKEIQQLTENSILIILREFVSSFLLFNKTKFLANLSQHFNKLKEIHNFQLLQLFESSGF